MLVIKQQLKELVISENKQVTKKGEVKSETKEIEQIKSREKKRKTERDHSGQGFMTSPKYLKKVLPWGNKIERKNEDFSTNFQRKIQYKIVKTWKD